ncbi:MAG: hypothetical protein A2068_05645 [Ignavibacteria bacterium GWB2_35_6b]|nr:MAG: hypothetical protein A2068_05645 [Ignavibacteria bacterium GWB2_35_6b]
MIFESLAAAVIPMLVYLLLLWKMDKYEPEPLTFVLKHFLWGAFGAVFFAVIGSKILSINLNFITTSTPFLEAILVAPFIEEITKGSFLFKTIKSKRFDNLTDGLVYGGAIGLGFGMTENFLYFITYGDTYSQWIFLVIVRSSFSAVMHCISTATVGAFLGFAKFSVKKNKSFLYPIGFIIAMFIHFAWNFSVSFQGTYLYGILFMAITIYSFFRIFKYSIKLEEKIILEELLTEDFPEDHVRIIASRLRGIKGWVDESIRKKYIAASTKLAFRKVQERNAEDEHKLFFQNEINFYRSEIISMRNNKNLEINLETKIE